MNVKTIVAACLVAAGLNSVSGQTQDLFRVSFRATCLATGASGEIKNSKLTDKDIIAQCLSSNGVAGRSQIRNFALVYNVGANSLQVVSAANGTLVCDVVQFQPVALTSDTRQTDQFAFMFLPDQTDAFGTAIITERVSNGTASDRVNIKGKLQFALTGDMMLGGNVTNTNGTDTNGTATATSEAATTNGLIEEIAAITGGNISGTNATTSTATNGTATTGTNVGSAPGTNTGAFTGPNVGSILGTNLTVIGTNAASTSPTNSAGSTTNVTTTPATNAIVPGSGSVFSIGSPAITVPTTSAFTPVTTNSTTATDTNLVNTGTDTNALAGVDMNAFVTVNAIAATNLTNQVNVRICTGTFSAGRRFVVTGASRTR